MKAGSLFDFIKNLVDLPKLDKWKLEELQRLLDPNNDNRYFCQAPGPGPGQVQSSPVRSSPVQVQSGPDLDLDLDKTQGPGLTLKSCRPPPLPTHYPLPTRQLLSMKEGSHTKTQRVKLTWNDPLNTSSIKNCRWTMTGSTWGSPPFPRRTKFEKLSSPSPKP